MAPRPTAGAGTAHPLTTLHPAPQLPSSDLSIQLADLAARDPEFDVALLVSYAPPPPDATAASCERVELDDEAWEDLAFEHGFEWVDVDPQAGTTKADDGLEEAGVGRLVAALHAHLWDNMERAAIPAARGDHLNSEGNSPEGPIGTTGESDDGDEIEFTSLGAPPLPEPRPFVPVPVVFPTTMLPSLMRKSRPPEFLTTDARLPSLAAANSGTSFGTNATASAAAAATPFEDDFATFVPPTSSFDQEAFAAPSKEAATGNQDGFEQLDDDEELELWRTSSAEEGDAAEEDVDREEDELSELVARLKGMRDEARGLGLEERRAVAERAVLGLLGE